MKRSEVREHIFRILFCVEFCEKEEFEDQVELYFHGHERGVLYYFNVCLEIYISGNENTDNSGSGRVDIRGCQNCDMHVPTEQLVYR